MSHHTDHKTCIGLNKYKAKERGTVEAHGFLLRRTAFLLIMTVVVNIPAELIGERQRVEHSTDCSWSN